MHQHAPDSRYAYQAAFVNGVGWNLLNLSIALVLLARMRGEGAGVRTRDASTLA
jgi:hypothetical protein